MDILVCIKQVPASNKVEVDPVTGVLLRNGADSKMNPYDLYALETALKIREEVGGTISVISMGPPQAMTVIREAFAMGVDRGALLSDRRFGGADVLATSYTIAQGIKKMGDFDLILCGKQTTDGDTAQVGSEVSEWLNIPSVSNVKKISKVRLSVIICIFCAKSCLFMACTVQICSAGSCCFFPEFSVLLISPLGKKFIKMRQMV